MQEIYNEFENTNSMIKILTIESLSIVRNGDISLAEKFTKSKEYVDFQQQIIKEGFEYARTTYQYSCIAFYTSIIMGNTPLSSAINILYESTKVKYKSTEEYVSALPELLLSFAKLASVYSKSYFNNQYLNKASQFIHDNIYDKIDQNALSKYCGCSISYLRHLFKSEAKQTMNNYINGVKILKACELLKKDSLTIDRISAQLGFSSESYFIVVFKKYMGISPGQYNHLSLDDGYID